MDKLITGPALQLPLQAAPVSRARNRGAVEAAAVGVEAASLFGFLKDLVTGDTKHMWDTATQDVWGWITG